MRKLALITAFSLIVIRSITQEYIKIEETTKINGRIFYKGEIFPKIAKNKILVGKDTIEFSKIKVDTTCKVIKNNIIEIKSFRDKYYIHVTKSKEIKDTIFLVNADDKKIPFYLKDSLLLNIKEYGTPFRIIIPNYPSLVFYESDFKNNVIHDSTNAPTTEVEENKIFTNELEWWQFLIGGVIVLMLLLLIYKIIKENVRFHQKQQITPEINPQTQNLNQLLSQIKDMETEILNQIKLLASNKESSQKIENLQKENESLKEKNTFLNKEIEQNKQKIIELNNELSQFRKKKQEIEEELNKYTEKVIFLDFLEPYAKAVYDYYFFCNKGYIKALDFYQKLNHHDSEIIFIVSQLLVKFNSNIPNKINHWVGLINEIKDSKATANIELINSLKQIPNDEEKLKEFKRMLLKEVFEKYSSSIFILTEEFSNLSKFLNDSNSFVKDIEQFFTNFKSELHIKSKTIELDLKYVPLFENYEKYAAFTKLVNQPCSLPYKNIKNISKDSVLEIINYGFGNEETNVILA